MLVSPIILHRSPDNIDTYLNTANNIQYMGASSVNGTAAAAITVIANDGDGSGDIKLGIVNDASVSAINTMI